MTKSKILKMLLKKNQGLERMIWEVTKKIIIKVMVFIKNQKQRVKEIIVIKNEE